MRSALRCAISVAIAGSIVATETSTVTFISVPGFAYNANFSFMQLVIGYMIGRIFVTVLFVPLYFRGELRRTEPDGVAVVGVARECGSVRQEHFGVVGLVTRNDPIDRDGGPWQAAFWLEVQAVARAPYR